MVTRCLIVALFGCAVVLASTRQSYGKRGAATTATAPSTKPSDNRKARTPDDHDVEDDVPTDVRKGKARAQQFEKGKPVDPAKTKGQLDKITSKVGGHEAALRNSTTK